MLGMAHKLPLSEQLRRLIEADDRTRYRISQETGIPQSTLSKFVNGGGMGWNSIDKVGKLLDLEIRKRATKRKGK